jgi:hypothetical protein
MMAMTTSNSIKVNAAFGNGELQREATDIQSRTKNPSASVKQPIQIRN